MYKIPSRSLARRIHSPSKTIREDREGTGGGGDGVGNPLSFSSAYEFPATYVYGFRDRFASREIGLSTYRNSPPAPSRRRTRTRAQDCPPSNYVFHQVRETSGAKESDFRDQDQSMRFSLLICYVLHPRLYISFFLSKETLFKPLRECKYSQRINSISFIRTK